MQDRNIEKLIFEMLGRQNKMMIDRILPQLERVASELNEISKETDHRFARLERACGDLAAELVALKNKQSGVANNANVREH